MPRACDARANRADEIARAVGRERGEERIDVVRGRRARRDEAAAASCLHVTSHASTVRRSRRSIFCAICTASRLARAKRSPNMARPVSSTTT